MYKELYIVAGERNIKAAPTFGGLYANVGETHLGVESRLKRDDYRRKAAGGKWIILYRLRVPHYLSDKDIHRLLKSHPRVRYEKSANTEEFFFIGDSGSGHVARQTFKECLSKIIHFDDLHLREQGKIKTPTPHKPPNQETNSTILKCIASIIFYWLFSPILLSLTILFFTTLCCCGSPFSNNP